MARKLLKDTCEMAARILDGEFDNDLQHIVQAAQARKKNMFRPGTKVRLVGTKNVALDGKVGTVLKVNAVRISVGVGECKRDQFGDIWSGGEFNVPPAMLEVVQ